MTAKDQAAQVERPCAREDNVGGLLNGGEDEGRVRWPSPRRDAQRYREGRVAKHRRHSLPPAHVARAWH